MPITPKQAAIAKVLGESRWRILGELCRLPQTASELADRVKTSANAVRVHLDALEEAGLVEYEVARRQVGKPTHVYSLTPAAEFLLSKAYVPALSAILNAAKEQAPASFSSILHKAGVALSRRNNGHKAPTGGLADAKLLFESLGAATTIDRSAAGAVLETACCPLSALTRDSNDLCVMMETALQSTTGINARQDCVRGPHPRCRFEFTSRGQQ
jgi:predicted ArsR family transcriptional regulator